MIDLDGHDYVTRAEAARILGINVSTIRSWERRGLIRPLHDHTGQTVVRLDQRVRYRWVDLAEAEIATRHATRSDARRSRWVLASGGG